MLSHVLRSPRLWLFCHLQVILTYTLWESWQPSCPVQTTPARLAPDVCEGSAYYSPERSGFNRAALCNLYQLGKPVVKPVEIAVPAGAGYVLTSAKSGRSLAIVDLEWIERELFRQVPTQDSRLVLAVTHNTAYYALGDATVCCSWGTHGVDTARRRATRRCVS
jgi:hypothetical protein